MARKPEDKSAMSSLKPNEKTEIKITPAKGRPMLTWVGKRPLKHVTAFPAQHGQIAEGKAAQPGADSLQKGLLGRKIGGCGLGTALFA